LDKLFYLAIGNKNIARALCKTAAQKALSNDELFDFIKDYLKKPRGRSKKWSLPSKKILLSVSPKTPFFCQRAA